MLLALSKNTDVLQVSLALLARLANLVACFRSRIIDLHYYSLKGAFGSRILIYR